MDWRFAEGGEKWQAVHKALNGPGFESMLATWDGMFGVKEEDVKKPTLKKTTTMLKRNQRRISRNRAHSLTVSIIFGWICFLQRVPMA